MWVSRQEARAPTTSNPVARASALCSLFLALAIASLVVVGCARPNNDANPGNPQQDPLNFKPTRISVDGSDTMAELLKSLSAEFKKENPSALIDLSTSNSGDGISELFNAETEIATASRPLTLDEEQLAEARGMRLKKTAIARDAIAIIVNRANKISQLSQPELKKILSGEVENWKQVGGADGVISVVGREASSGTSRYLKEHILAETDFANTATEMKSHTDVIRQVTNDPNAIGYVGFSAVKPNSGVKILGLTLTDSPGAAVIPTKQTLVSDYPLSRPLYLIAISKTTPLADQFIKFCLSDKAQKIVSDLGLVPAR